MNSTSHNEFKFFKATSLFTNLACILTIKKQYLANTLFALRGHGNPWNVDILKKFVVFNVDKVNRLVDFSRLL